MRDEPNDIVPGQVALVGADGEVLNKTNKARQPRVRPTHNKRRDFAMLMDLDSLDAQMRGDVEEIVRRVNDAIPVAALAVGEKMYEQFSEETSTLLQDMEHIIAQRVRNEVMKELAEKGLIEWTPPPEEPPELSIVEEGQ